MAIQSIVRPLVCLAAAILLEACGDVSISSKVGGKGTWIPPLDEDPEPAYTMGRVTGLGSITIHGIRYSTNAALVTLNGEPGNIEQLKKGHVVAVIGEINRDGVTGTAHELIQEGGVIGTIDAADPASSRLVVLGQVVKTSARTHFGNGIDPDSFAGLEPGTRVQVSGFPDLKGEFDATRIETHAGERYQVVGAVAGLDEAYARFQVGGLIVDYTNASEIDLPGEGLVNGVIVTLTGTPVEGVFRAERIREALIAASPDVPGKRTQLEGRVTRAHAGGSFALNEIEIVTHANTRFVDGSAEDLRAGTQVAVSGRVAGSGNGVRADVVSFGSLHGALVTVDFDVAEFDSLEISGLISATVIRGDDYSVSVTVDEDVAGNVIVDREGSTLHLGLQFGDNNVDTLDAVVTMPWLTHVQLSGLASARLLDFDQMEMSIVMAGLNRVIGENLKVGHLSAVLSSISLLDFTDTQPLASASIQVAGTSRATLNMDVGASLEGAVAAWCTLYYYGTAVSTEISTAWSGSVRHLGATRQ